jgi:hypothetical protein
MLLDPLTTWRHARADRAALLIDMEAYFDAAMEAMRLAGLYSAALGRGNPRVGQRRCRAGEPA